jgi:hypothetical protein
MRLPAYHWIGEARGDKGRQGGRTGDPLLQKQADPPPRSSWRPWLGRWSPSTGRSATSTSSSRAAFTGTSSPVWSPACPGLAPCRAQSSGPPPAATWPASAPQTGWPPSPAWLPHPGTLVASAATCTAPGPTTAACSASSTTPPWSASAPVWSPAASTTASGPRANATPRPCWPWPDGAATYCGRCCATSGPTGQHTCRRRRLTRSPGITPTT